MSIDETADALGATLRERCNTIGENHAGNLTAISVMLKEYSLTVSAFSVIRSDKIVANFDYMD